MDAVVLNSFNGITGPVRYISDNRSIPPLLNDQESQSEDCLENRLRKRLRKRFYLIMYMFSYLSRLSARSDSLYLPARQPRESMLLRQPRSICIYAPLFFGEGQSYAQANQNASR